MRAIYSNRGTIAVLAAVFTALQLTPHISHGGITAASGRSGLRPNLFSRQCKRRRRWSAVAYRVELRFMPQGRRRNI